MRKANILILMAFLVSTVSAQIVEDTEPIKITTELVQTVFLLPTEKDMTQPMRVFDGEKEITQFNVTRGSADNKLKLVVILDMQKCVDGKSCRREYRFGEMFRTMVNNLRNTDRLSVVISTENLSEKQTRNQLDWSGKSVPAKNLFEAAEIANSELAESKQARQAILILTNKVEDLREDAYKHLQTAFDRAGAFVQIMTINTSPVFTKSSWVGWNNLGLPGFTVVQNDKVVLTQLAIFADIANHLAAISYQSDSEEDFRQLKIKTYTKIYGEQTRERKYVSKIAVNDGVQKSEYQKIKFNRPECENYYQPIVESLEEKQVIKADSQLHPVVKQNLVSGDSNYSMKIAQATSWLNEDYKWRRPLPSVVFNLKQPYVGLQESGKVAFSTRALEILNVRELQAVVAHEIAHLILAGEPYSEATEYKCDLIAYFIMPPSSRQSLFSAIQKMSDKNYTGSLQSHVSPESRIAFLNNSLNTLKSQGVPPCEDSTEKADT